MQTVVTGKVWKFGDRISTDFMMPGSRVLANPNMTRAEKAACCMEANRPGWATNEVESGDIVVGEFTMATTAGALTRDRVGLDARNPDMIHVVIPPFSFTPPADTTEMTAYSYCNQHGLWRSEVIDV